MPLRSRLLVVVLALFAAVCAVIWLARADAAAPAASVGASTPSAQDVARTEPGAIAAAAADAPTETPSPRAELAIEPQSLHGIVVDEAGVPVADATIASVHGYSATPLTTTGVDGRFAVDRSAEDRTLHVELRAAHADFDLARAWGRWGSDDVRLVLRARVPIEVRVVDENGDPVRISRATCEADGVDFSGAKTELVADGYAWRGMACRGTNSLSIRFADEASVAREVFKRRQISVAEPGPMQFRFVAATMLPRYVKVVAPDGVPVANARVELIDGRGGVVTAYQRTVSREFALGPVEVGKAKTDEAGATLVAGPVGRSLVVRATRDGFAPGLVADVRVPGPDAVVVSLGRGASGSGRLRADPLLAERIAAGDCGLLFTQAADMRSWPDPKTSPDGIALATNGSFAFAGAPPGVWNVRWVQPCGQSKSAAMAAENCGVSVELHEGHNPPLVVDLRDRRWTEVNLRIRIEGRTASGATVAFTPTTDPYMVHGVAECDAKGRCSTRLRPGSYVLRPLSILQYPESSFGILSVAGDCVDRELDLRSGEIEVTLVDTKGNPRRGLLCCALLTVDVDWVTGWPPADGDGVFRQRCSAGEWAVFAWSRQLENQAKTIDWSRDDVLLQLARARHLLGTVTVRAGETTKATLVVPDDVPR